jgi:hypothetical protein
MGAGLVLVVGSLTRAKPGGCTTIIYISGHQVYCGGDVHQSLLMAILTIHQKQSSIIKCLSFKSHYVWHLQALFWSR